jgi:hypothetical protein
VAHLSEVTVQLGLNEQQHRVAVAQHVLDRCRGRGRVEHDAGGAEMQRRGLGDRELRPVARKERHALTAAYAKRRERAGVALDRSRVSRPG